MDRWLFRYSVFTAFLTLLLLVAGGLVTSTGSALAVPDWPLAYGQFFPPMVGGIFFEHGHRLIASTVGFLTIILTVWVWKTSQISKVRWLGVWALLAVILQGVLGGLTVIFLLPTPISVGHAMLGQTFFCVVVIIALTQSKFWTNLQKVQIDSGQTLVRLAFFTTLALFIQLFLGSYMRHTHSGLIIPDFPRALGEWIPPIENRFVLIHFLHRVWAIVVLSLVSSLFYFSFMKFRNQKHFVWISLGMLGLVCVQGTLGAYTIWSQKAVAIVTSHVVVGAIVLASSVLFLVLSTFQFGHPWERADFKKWADYSMLTKPRITFMVCLTTWAGIYLAKENVSKEIVFWSLLATGLVASGASALNQFLERELDGLMKRTASRPLPCSRLTPFQAFIFGMLITFVGLVLFSWKVNSFAMALAAFTHLSYLLVYTPLKRTTSLSTLVGAIPGAMPPVIGWISATNEFEIGALILFSILFLWQMPHFFSIGWLYREDYARAQFQVLSVLDPEGYQTGKQSMFYSLLLFPIACLPAYFGLAGPLYLISAILLGITYILASQRLAKCRTHLEARRLLITSVIYLPALFILMVVDKVR